MQEEEEDATVMVAIKTLHGSCSTAAGGAVAADEARRVAEFRRELEVGAVLYAPKGR